MKKTFALIALTAVVLQAENLPVDTLTTTTTAVINQTDTSAIQPINNSSIDSSDSCSLETHLETGYSTYRFNFGGNYYDMTEVSRALSHNDFPTLDNASVQFGFGRTTQKAVIVKEMGVTVHSWRNASNALKKSDLTGVDFSLSYGPDIVKSQRASLFPFAGADIGILLLKMSYKSIPYAALAQAAGPADEILHRFTLNGLAGVGFDIRAIRDGFMPSIGFRAGYSFDLTAQANWSRNLSGVSNGPKAPTSGPFARIVFGIALPR